MWVCVVYVSNMDGLTIGHKVAVKLVPSNELILELSLGGEEGPEVEKKVAVLDGQKRETRIIATRGDYGVSDDEGLLFAKRSIPMRFRGSFETALYCSELMALSMTHSNPFDLLMLYKQSKKHPGTVPPGYRHSPTSPGTVPPGYRYLVPLSSGTVSPGHRPVSLKGRYCLTSPGTVSIVPSATNLKTNAIDKSQDLAQARQDDSRQIHLELIYQKFRALIPTRSPHLREFVTIGNAPCQVKGR
ncbi:hypothetical protein Hamer_G026954 [Homarus americanus]|uniref:Uncharacterized protein n=1 Tax=Homarus americanus TaxID=6706 RepID=A0A8J5KIS6_HOMAM|nr:hypothetical protein Hamer_G026954 [Homarus americanus]